MELGLLPVVCDNEVDEVTLVVCFGPPPPLRQIMKADGLVVVILVR